MLARGSLGNPWLFERLLGGRDGEPPRPTRSLDELDWVIDRAEEHLGAERAGRYLRKFYPWYVERLGGAQGAASERARSATHRTTPVAVRPRCTPAEPDAGLRAAA